MTRLISRLALVAMAVVALSGLGAATALAENNPSVVKVTKITPESAVVSGTIDTSDTSAPLWCYSFAYDTASDLKQGGGNLQGTPSTCLPSGGSAATPVSAVIGCYPALTCGFASTLLTPGSKYVVYLTVTSGQPSSNYYLVQSFDGAPSSFKTPPLGSVQVSSSITSSGRKAHIDLKCASVEPCRGTITVTARHGKLTCVSGNFSVKAGKSAVAKEELSKRCARLIAAAGTSGIPGKLAITTTTDQAGPAHLRVTLT